MSEENLRIKRHDNKKEERKKKNNDDDDKMYGILFSFFHAFLPLFNKLLLYLLWNIKTMTSPHLHFQKNKSGKQQDQFDTYT